MDITKLREVKGLIAKAFSEDGLVVDGYTVKCQSPLTTHLYGDDAKVQLLFGGTRPVLSVTKFITFSVELEEFYLHDEGGTIKLKNFPDINFEFANMSEVICGGTDESCTNEFYVRRVTGICEEIDSQFGDPARQRIAHKCLQYAQAWATMSMDGGTNFASMSARDIKLMKAECRAFVKAQIKQEERHGSIIVIFLVQMILPYIIKWIVERVIDKLING